MSRERAHRFGAHDALLMLARMVRPRLAALMIASMLCGCHAQQPQNHRPATEQASVPPQPDPKPAPVIEAKEVTTKSGLRLRVYEVALPMTRLWPLQPDQTPNFETVIPELSLTTKEQFGGYES